MKFNKWPVGLSLLALVIAFAMFGCTTPQQRTAFTTVASVDQAAKAAYDGYDSLVIRNILTTNDVPKVSKAYNDLEIACKIVALSAQSGTNALAPQVLTTQLADFLTIIQGIVPPTTK